MPDSDIAQAIERHFQDEGLLRSDHLKVVVTHGTAILSGFVGSLMAKERALDVTGMIRGVRAITDQVLSRTEALYDEALQASWPDEIQRVLAAQRSRLRDEADELSKLEF